MAAARFAGELLDSYVPPRLRSVATTLLKFGLGVLPFYLLVTLAITGWHDGLLGFDFRGTLWDPGTAILAGHNPYPLPHESALRTGNPAAYPPALMLIVAPLTVLPWSVGVVVWLLLLMAAVGGALWLLGVRDWRIYCIVVACDPFRFGLTDGNISLLLLLGLALAWRWRDDSTRAAIAVAALVVAKLFLWPLFVWLVVTRRLRAAALGAIFAVVGTVVSWALIGFDGLRSYPHLLEALDRVYATRSISLTSLGVRSGMSLGAAEVGATVIALALLGVAAAVARQAEGDRRMYSAAVIASLAATPIMWLHYLTLLLVPLVLYRPRLTRAWWIVVGFWAVTIADTGRYSAKPCCIPHGMHRIIWITLTTFPGKTVLTLSALMLASTALLVLRTSRPAVALEPALQE